eukprot:3156792-Pyramimonas_sp.AAC.1
MHDDAPRFPRGAEVGLIRKEGRITRRSEKRKVASVPRKARENIVVTPRAVRAAKKPKRSCLSSRIHRSSGWTASAAWTRP